MINKDVSEISNSELIERISILQSKERSIVLKFLIHLGEFDKRRLYLEQGYSSLFDYCTRKLRLSESSAFRRIESARFLREHPECAESFLARIYQHRQKWRGTYARNQNQISWQQLLRILKPDM